MTHYLEKEFFTLLKEDASVFRFIKAGALDGIWYWDLDHPAHEWMSPTFWRTLGYDPSAREHLASEWQDLIHPDDLQVALENFQMHLDDPSHPYDQVVRYRHQEGHWVWIRCRGMAIRDDAGTPHRMIGIHIDVTEVQHSRAIQRLYEHTPALLLALTANHTIEFVSERWLSHFGYTRDAVIDREVEAFLTEASHQRFEADLRPRLVADGVGEGEPLEWICGDGSTREIELSATTEHHHGRVTRTLIAMRDVTELNHSNRALQRRTQQLERSNKDLEQFAFAASHELQEPLRKINGFTDLVLDEDGDKLSDNSLSYLQVVQRAVLRMKSLIDALLSFSLLQPANRLTFQEVDLAEVFNEARGALSLRLEETGGRLEVVGDLPIIEGEPTHLHHLLQNLLSNALKFHKPDTPPHVRVSASVMDGWCELRVEDNGIGIEPRYQARIFQVFKRLHGRSQYQGTGIGLALSLRIAEHHGGTLNVQSQLGEGATFIARLPVHPQEHI
ncbi:MAG: hypothetical protein CMH57_06240 [Myxococcales bacterium]|nr:hypothetical protein [Myxococcales bacterium]